MLKLKMFNYGFQVPGSPRSLNLDSEENFNSLSSREDSGTETIH
jgi:hypothetical protein